MKIIVNISYEEYPEEHVARMFNGYTDAEKAESIAEWEKSLEETLREDYDAKNIKIGVKVVAE